MLNLIKISSRRHVKNTKKSDNWKRETWQKVKSKSARQAQAAGKCDQPC
jgi:hypothetical protein